VQYRAQASKVTKMSMLETTDLQQRIAAKIDTKTAAFMKIDAARTSGVTFSDMGQVMEFAKMMAISDVGVRKHLRGNVGACLAVTIQAIEWEMSPFAVASKSYSVNDQIAYEAQLINAVILRRAPIVGRFKISYTGMGDSRVCTVALAMRDGGPDAVYESPPFAKIQPKNSPLWKSDPDQQQFYSSSRALCRRHFPDVLLGVYAVDEVVDGGGFEPIPQRTAPARIKDQGERIDRLIESSLRDGETIDPQTGEITKTESKNDVDYVAASSEGRLNGVVVDKETTAAEQETAAAGAVDKPQEGAGPSSSQGSPAPTERDAAILADLLETGVARAESGAKALQYFLDGLEPGGRKLIPNETVEGWIRTAKAARPAK
jgi:hypothetical protein